ncbi:MAG: TonB-dependent receptor [Deltaproteobacteria bacterium]|nr:TonB-dependent receptor [Deltaproteobacteria bacterium]
MKYYLYFFLFFSFHPTFAVEIIVTAPKDAAVFPEGSFTTVIDTKNYPQNKLSAKDLLTKISGTYIAHSNGLTEEETLSIRGFSSNQVTILVDGIPIDPAKKMGWSLSEMPAASIDKIIVSKGPLSSLFGSSAMGGVIHILTKKNISQTKLALSVGSFSTKKLNGTLFKNFSKHKISMLAFADSTLGNFPLPSSLSSELSDPQNPSSTELKNNTSSQYGGDMHYTFDHLSFPVRVSMSYVRRNRDIPGLEGHLFQNIHEKSQLTKASFTSSLNIPAWKSILDTMGYVQFHEKNYEDPDGEYNGFPEFYLRKNRQFGIHTSPRFFITNFLTLTPSFSFDFETFQDHDFKKYRNTLHQALSTTLNLFQGKGWITPLLSHSKATDLPSEFNLGLSSAYALFPSFRLKANLNSGFRSPSFDELFFKRGIFVGNETLSPEKTVGGDLGFEFYRRDQFSLALSYFLYNTKNLIEYLLISGFQYKPFNFRTAVMEGVEIETILNAIPRMTFQGNLTVQNVIDLDQNSEYYGRFIPGRPRWYGTQFAEIQLFKNFKVHSFFHLALQRFTNKSNTKPLLDRYSIDLGSDYQLFKNSSLSFEINNILNRANVDVRGVRIAGRGLYGTLTHVF